MDERNIFLGENSDLKQDKSYVDYTTVSIEEVVKDLGLDVNSEEDLKIVRNAIRKVRSLDDFVMDAQFLEEDMVDGKIENEQDKNERRR